MREKGVRRFVVSFPNSVLGYDVTLQLPVRQRDQKCVWATGFQLETILDEELARPGDELPRSDGDDLYLRRTAFARGGSNESIARCCGEAHRFLGTENVALCGAHCRSGRTFTLEPRMCF